jgi:hypothetical protein
MIDRRPNVLADGVSLMSRLHRSYGRTDLLQTLLPDRSFLRVDLDDRRDLFRHYQYCTGEEEVDAVIDEEMKMQAVQGDSRNTQRFDGLGPFAV